MYKNVKENNLNKGTILSMLNLSNAWYSNLKVVNFQIDGQSLVKTFESVSLILGVFSTFPKFQQSYHKHNCLQESLTTHHENYFNWLHPF